MSKIKEIKAREILASGGDPSLEVHVELESGKFGVASVSYGASAGSKEAFVLLDGDKERYHGKGMLKAVENANTIIAPLLIGLEADEQRVIDNKMISADGTQNKSKLGANAILGVSMAVARAAAADSGLELYDYLRKICGLENEKYSLPKPMAVMIEGGKHADNSTDFQEYLLTITKEQSVKDNVLMMENVYQALKVVLKENNLSVNVGNEGAFAPDGIASNELPLQYLVKAITDAGYSAVTDCGVSMDLAASEFYHDGKYILSRENKELSSQEIIDMCLGWFKKYPMVTCEDMLSEFDWENWPKITASANIPIIADDLTVTNVKLWQKAIELKAANAILIKLNQAGSVTETLDCCMLAKKYNFPTIPSHRGGGETEDTFLVDLGVAMGSSWIKVGPTRGERVSKYNRLMEIEDKINNI